MGPVKGVLLDQSFLFSVSDGEEGRLHLLPGAENLLLRLQYSLLHVGISYKASFSPQEEASIQSVAVQYTLQVVLFDASCLEQRIQETSSAWDISPDTCVFVTTELDEVIISKICSQGWALVFQDSRNAVSAMPGVTTIKKLEDLLFTLCHLNKMAMGDSIVAVGYVMKWTREKDFLKRGAFPILPTGYGLTFVPINLDLELMPQLQVVDLILHKVTDEILSIDRDQLQSISEGIKFSDGIQKLQRRRLKRGETLLNGIIRMGCSFGSVIRIDRYMKDMHYCMIDPFENIIPLLDRVATQLILQDLVEINDPRHRKIRTPHYLKISSFDEPDLLERIDQAQLFLPAIIKPQIACGVSNAHTMAVVFNKDDFLGVPVPLPAVIQEYIDHGSIVYKFYVLGTKVFYAVRGSTPNAASLLLSSGSKGSSIVVFDSLKSLPVDSMDNQKSEVGKEKLDLEIVVSAAMWLREKLHLTIFGFDVVIQAGTGDHVIVDVNYLPSFKEIPDDSAIPAFWEAIKSSYESFKSKDH